MRPIWTIPIRLISHIRPIHFKGVNAVHALDAVQLHVENNHQRTPSAHRFPCGLVLCNWLEVLRTTLQTEAVCEFFIYLNRDAASCPTVLAQ
jgi:hypothetical protein